MSRNRLFRAAPLALLVLVIYAFGYGSRFVQTLGVPVMKPSFADLRQLVSAADRANEGVDVFQWNAYEGQIGPYNYSTLLLRGMQFLRLNQADTNPLGLVLVLAFTLSSAFVLAPRTRGQFAVGVASLASPSALLAIDRGNLDIAICAALIAVAVLVASSKLDAPEWVTVALLVSGAVFTKYYPVLVMPALVAIRRDRASRIVIALATVVLITAYFLVFPADIHHLRTLTPAPRPALLAFGGSHLFILLGLHHGARVTALAAGLSAGAAGAFLGAKSAAGERSAMGRFDRAWILVGGVVYAGCFVLNGNFDYRRVLLVMVLPALYRLADEKAPRLRLAARAAIVLLLALMWSLALGRLVRHLPGPALAQWIGASFLTLRQLMDWGFLFVLSFCAAAAFRCPDLRVIDEKVSLAR